MVMLLIYLLGCYGCIERRLTINSNPPGATVLMDGRKIGRTPLKTSFLFYGVRSVTLYKKGYATYSCMEPLRPPWYAVTPLDVFTDLLCPVTIADQHHWQYTLKPYPPFTSDLRAALLQRAKQTRAMLSNDKNK